MECILILTQIRLALVFFVIHKDIGSLFGVLGWKYILSKKISCGTVNCPEAIKNNRDRKSTRLNSSHREKSRMPSSA